MKFKLEIELGNDAMQTPSDVRRALREIAATARFPVAGEEDEGRIGDENGNTVGRWEFVESQGE